VGESLWDNFDPALLRATSSLGGGLGSSQQELCGALGAGALIIGVVHGRTKPDQNNDYCKEVAVRYRDRFLKEWNYTRCADLRAQGFGSTWPCATLVEKTTTILLEILNGDVENRGGHDAG
jgi:hypothetical protein